MMDIAATSPTHVVVEGGAALALSARELVTLGLALKCAGDMWPSEDELAAGYERIEALRARVEALIAQTSIPSSVSLEALAVLQCLRTSSW